MTMSIFRDGFKLRCFQLLSAYDVATRRCLARQPVNQKSRTPVPLVLKAPSLQTSNTPTEKQPYCLAT